MTLPVHEQHLEEMTHDSSREISLHYTFPTVLSSRGTIASLETYIVHNAFSKVATAATFIFLFYYYLYGPLGGLLMFLHDEDLR